MSERPASAVEAPASSGPAPAGPASTLGRLRQTFVAPRATTATSMDPAADGPATAASAPLSRVDGATTAITAPRPSAVLRVRDVFVRPAATSRKSAAAAPRPAPRIALVCAAEDAAALGVAAASILARRHRSDCALACVWSPGGVSRSVGEGGPLAGRAARRLATALAARDVPSTARGRLAIALPLGDAATAAPVAARALAAARAAPTVLALGGSREPAFDLLLADQDLVVVATRPSASGPLAELALAAVADVATRVVACEVGPTPAGRLLATAGLRIPPALRRALSAPLEAIA
jgi:hypothetical protein